MGYSSRPASTQIKSDSFSRISDVAPSEHTRSVRRGIGFVQAGLGRVAQPFDLAGHSNIMGAPSFACFAKGGRRKCLSERGRSRDAAAGAVQAVWYDKQNSTGI